MMLCDLLRATYVALTIAKITQWFLLFLSSSPAKKQTKNDDDDDSSNYNETVAGSSMYSPSVRVGLVLLELFLPFEVSKVPRKELRQVTDPWLQAYTKRVTQPSRRANSKKFDTLDAAVRDFFCDFCQETFVGSYYIDYMQQTGLAFNRHPLGLVALCELVLLAYLTPFVLVREILLCGGSGHSLLCKAAAAATAPELYVLACKKKLSFEEALHAYPWVQGMFTRKQIHPMVARAVCPMHKREIVLPTWDVMNFDVEVIDCFSGTLVVKQKRKRHHEGSSSSWSTRIVDTILFVWDEMTLGHYIVLATIAAACHLEGLNNLFWVAVCYAVPFYCIRVLVDKRIGLRWSNRFRYLP